MSSVLTCDTCERPIPSTVTIFHLEERSMVRTYSRPEDRELDFCSASCGRKWFDDEYPETRLTKDDFDRAHAPLLEHDCAVTGCVICDATAGQHESRRLSVLPVPDTTGQRITKDEWGTGA